MPSFYVSIFSRFRCEFVHFPFWMRDFHPPAPTLLNDWHPLRPALLVPHAGENILQAMWNFIILSALSPVFVFHQILTTSRQVIPPISRYQMTATAPGCQRSLRFTNNPIAKKAHVSDLNVLLYHASEVQFVDCMRLARNVICAAY
jgi:hypothetical protein